MSFDINNRPRKRGCMIRNATQPSWKTIETRVLRAAVASSRGGQLETVGLTESITRDDTRRKDDLIPSSIGKNYIILI